MSIGYFILFYKNSIIEPYINNFLMTKYISLNNAMGSNELILKTKNNHHNYFCFINKEKKNVRCIVKLSKITNYQIDLEIERQQEITLPDLKNSDILKNESKFIDNFFGLENNNNPNTKINLIIKESNNIYEFNCVFLDNPVYMGIFEKIKRCMEVKEYNHNNEIQNNLRNNPFMSNILNYQAAFRKTNQDNNTSKGLFNFGGNTLSGGIFRDGDDKINKEMLYFDMKYDKYFLYDELLIDKKENNDIFFPKNQTSNHDELIDKYKEIFKISDTVFKKPFSELDDIKGDINCYININKSSSSSSSSVVNSNKKNNETDNNSQSVHDYKNKEDKKTNYENISSNKDNNNADNNKMFYYNSNNSSSGNINKNNKINNISEDIRDDEYSDKNNYRKGNDLYINNYKKEITNNISYNNYIDNSNNYNYRDYNNNYKYYNTTNDNSSNKYSSRNSNLKKNNDKSYKDSNQVRGNYFNNNNSMNQNYINNNRNDRNDNYLNSSRNDDGIRNYSNNNYNYSSSNNSSFSNDKGRNYSRSREKSPISSPNSNSLRYNSPQQKKYDKYDKYDRYNDRNNSYKSNNYYGNNNNINYYYNINNYYRPGTIGRWSESNYRSGGGNYSRDNYQQNKNDNYTNYFNNNYEGHYNRERRRVNQNNNY